MARNPRISASDNVNHAYCRVSHGEMIFTDEDVADHWANTVPSTNKIRGLTILAWCLLSNHYHPLCRPGTKAKRRAEMKIQVQTVVHFNLHHLFTGGLWQSRYRARRVVDEDSPSAPFASTQVSAASLMIPRDFTGAVTAIRYGMQP